MAWGPIAAAVGSSVADYIGNRNANKANASLSRESLALSRDQLYRGHQIEVEDMRAAGLNPVLSATGGSGASGAFSVSGNQTNPLSSARDVASKSIELENAKKQGSLLDAQVDKTRADARLSNAEADKQEVLKSPFEAIKSSLPQIKSTASDMKNFYTGDSDLSPRGIYNWLNDNLTGKASSSARDIKVDHSAVSRELRARGLKPIEIRPLPRSSK